MIKIKMQSKAT